MTETTARIATKRDNAFESITWISEIGSVVIGIFLLNDPSAAAAATAGGGVAAVWIA
jgi:hypothetical protein